MTKRAVQALGLFLLAAPLTLVGCGSDSSSGTDAGTDAPIGRLDSATTTDAPAAIDQALPQTDGGIIDAPVTTDGSSPDGSVADTATPVDLAPAVDTLPPVDLAPVVCTEATKFSGGNVSANRTLTKACTPYTITDDINVGDSAILTIEPGVTLNFQANTVISVGYSTSGRLVANGTATDKIVFTSPTKGAGDWAGIRLYGNTMVGTSISYATLEYCGQDDRGCITGDTGVKAGRVTLDHVTFDRVGPGSNAIDENDANSNFTINNCTFKNIPTNRYAISVYAPSFAGIDSTNAFNGSKIEVAGGTVDVTTTWKNPGTPVVVTSDLNLQGTPAPVLTIAAGSTFQFAQNTGFSVGYSGGGNLKVTGTATAPVTFTSANSTPAVGDWNGIMIWGASQATIDNANVSYGGGDTNHSGDVAAYNGAKLTISNSKLSFSSGWGLWLDCGSTATITDSNISGTDNAKALKGPGPDGPDCQ